MVRDPHRLSNGKCRIYLQIINFNFGPGTSVARQSDVRPPVSRYKVHNPFGNFPCPGGGYKLGCCTRSTLEGVLQCSTPGSPSERSEATSSFEPVPCKAKYCDLRRSNDWYERRNGSGPAPVPRFEEGNGNPTRRSTTIFFSVKGGELRVIWLSKLTDESKIELAEEYCSDVRRKNKI